MMAGWFGGIVCTKDDPWRRETILSIPMKSAVTLIAP
jgi:hypothetical protein